MNKYGIFQFFQKNGVQLLLQALGVLVVFVNLWLASKLAPLSERFIKIEGRVSAIEDRNKIADPFIPRFIVTEQKELQNGESIKEVKERLIRIEGKIDRLVERKSQ